VKTVNMFFFLSLMKPVDVDANDDWTNVSELLT